MDDKSGQAVERSSQAAWNGSGKGGQIVFTIYPALEQLRSSEAIRVLEKATAAVDLDKPLIQQGKGRAG